MARISRRSIAARMAAPTALVGAVAIFGLVAFSSGPGRHDDHDDCFYCDNSGTCGRGPDDSGDSSW